MNRHRLAALVATAVLPLALVSNPSPATAAQHGGQGGYPAVGQAGRRLPPPRCETTLTVQQADDLRFMRDEERLALDLYTLFRKVYEHGASGSTIFKNIADAEQNHFDAVGRMLDEYCVPDPAFRMPAGEFESDVVQGLYDWLEPMGLESYEGALGVGVIVEETDIHDINAILERGNPADITQVYEHLLAGSYNHLAAFTSRLEQIG